MDEIKKETELFTPSQFLDLYYRCLNYLVQSPDWEWVQDSKGWGVFEICVRGRTMGVGVGLEPLTDDEIKIRARVMVYTLSQIDISINSVQKYPSTCQCPLYWANTDGRCLVCSKGDTLAQVETDDIKLDLDQAKRLHKELAKTRKRPNVVQWTLDGEMVS